MEASQIFVYVVSIVVVGLVLLFGTQAIMRWNQDVSRVNYVQFKTKLINTIDEVASDYGSVKQVQFHMPSTYERLCFVDLEHTIIPPDLRDDYPLLADAWDSGTANVFLVADTVQESFKEERIVIEDQDKFLCLDRQSGGVKVRLEGLGRKVKVSSWR